jgi:16S rRNA (guanine966-N2)-methyltransferase
MITIKVIAGELKGRAIPFSNKKFDGADITSQKIKGAIFSIIGEWLEGNGFLDLFAGSGQVGIEALSRGADPVVINEKDGKRFNFIKSLCSALNLSRQPLLLNLDYPEALDFLKNHSIMFDYVFLDPPYHKSREGVPQYRQIIEGINDCGILKEGGKIIIQHYSNNIIQEQIGPFNLMAKKSYGKSSLSIYK